MRRRTAFFAALLALGGAVPCLAQDRPAAAAADLDPRNLAIAREIIDISNPPETRRAMMARAVDEMMAQARVATTQVLGDRLDADARQIFDRFLGRVRSQSNRLIAEGSPAIFAALTRAYARRFTYDELVQIRAFVATPAGARFAQRSDDLLSDPDVARANTAYMAAAFAALQPLQAQLIEELRAYLETRDRRGASDGPATGTR